MSCLCCPDPTSCNMRKAESSVQDDDDSIPSPRWPLASPAWYVRRLGVDQSGRLGMGILEETS